MELPTPPTNPPDLQLNTIWMCDVMKHESRDTQDPIGMPLVKTLWKDFRALGTVMKNYQKLSWPAIYKSFSKTDVPSFVILDMNFITVPECDSGSEVAMPSHPTVQVYMV